MSLAYDRRGQGPPLMLVHGLGSYRGMWVPVLDRLAAEREVIAVDLPGFGDSPLLPGGARHDVSTLTEAVERFIDGLGVGTPHVAGNSLGGGIALELARRGTVRSATALSPIGFWTPAEARYAAASLRGSRALARALRPLTPRLMRSTPLRTAFLGQIYARPWRLDPDAALATVEAFRRAPGFDVTLPNTFRYYFWGVPRSPVTVAWGTRDRLLLPVQAERAREALPEARHVALQGCGHVPPSDDPDQVAEVLLAGSR
ncbi:MAG: alpha/beta fold hydrolase [Streptosporangiales bacterium]|nr:alpha/beta fold hydrolase [Streptosporangiales bacterium]